MKLYPLMALLYLAIPAWLEAGAVWSGGGGRLQPDDQNPWFVGNTQHVYYCVEISDEFGVSKERAIELIDLAVDYWKTELRENVKANTNFRGIIHRKFFHSSNSLGRILNRAILPS